MSPSERKKLSSDDLEWFQYEIKSFTETRLSMAAARNALSITGQKLLRNRPSDEWINVKSTFDCTFTDFANSPHFGTVDHEWQIVHDWNVNEFSGTQNDAFNGIYVLCPSDRAEWRRRALWKARNRHLVSVPIKRPNGTYRKIHIELGVSVEFDRHWISGVHTGAVFFRPERWNDSTLFAHVPVNVEHFRDIIRKARAIGHQHAQLLHLRQGAPVHVRTSDVPFAGKKSDCESIRWQKLADTYKCCWSTIHSFVWSTPPPNNRLKSTERTSAAFSFAKISVSMLGFDLLGLLCAIRTFSLRFVPAERNFLKIFSPCHADEWL